MSSKLSDVMHVCRIRSESFRSAGRWINKPVSVRVDNLRRAQERLHPSPWDAKPWQPPQGRESPREEWMEWRRSTVRYEFAGWMRFYHGKAMPLVGSRLLYVAREPKATLVTATGGELGPGRSQNPTKEDGLA